MVCVGLYQENSKRGLGFDMWELKHGKRSPTVADTDEWVHPENIRNPEEVALQPRHVKQITRSLSGLVSTWKPPAGIYLENSKRGLNQNMWKLLKGARDANGGRDAGAGVRPQSARSGVEEDPDRIGGVLPPRTAGGWWPAGDASKAETTLRASRASRNPGLGPVLLSDEHLMA